MAIYDTTPPPPPPPPRAGQADWSFSSLGIRTDDLTFDSVEGSGSFLFDAVRPCIARDPKSALQGLVVELEC